MVVFAVVALGALCAYNAIQWIGKPFAGFLANRRLVVSGTGLPGWTGSKVGIRSTDKIIGVGPSPGPDDVLFREEVNSRQIGEAITYKVKRGKQLLDFTIATMRFSISDLLMTFGSYCLQGMIYVLIGVIVFILKPDTTVSWIFLLITMAKGSLAFIEFELSSTRTMMVYPSVFCDALLPALAIHFAAIFPTKLEFAHRRKWILRLPYLYSFLLFILLWAVYPRPIVSKYYTYGIYSYSFVAVLFFLATLAYSYFKSQSTQARQRARIIFLGTLVAFPFPLAAVTMTHLGHDIRLNLFTNFTQIPLLIFPAAIAFSIIRHNLFDVDVYIRRAVGYGLMTTIVGSVYFVLQLTVKSVIFAPILGSSAEYVYPVIFALFVVFLFNPLNRMVQDVVDRVFFRKKFDYKEAVISISNALSSVLNLDEIVQQVNRCVRNEMFIDNSGVIVLGNTPAGHRGFMVSDLEDGAGYRSCCLMLPENDPLIALVAREKRLITKYDIAEDPRYAADRLSCGSRFEELDASLAIPLIYQDKVNAVITVGHKKSGHYFTKEDIELLTTLASHGAVSIENARMAEQMQKEEIVRTNLSRYLSPQVVEGIVKSDMQVNLGGDRKVVTVLFSDIRNFTSITESRPPDQLVRLLNEYFTGMAEVIFANQGSLDKYIGDAIVAVFGSLIPLEHPETHAVNAAIGMMRKLQELNKLWLERGDFTMEQGIGINTGEVFLGNIGSSDRMEFTVIGDTVNVASRFSSLAQAGQILATESVAMRLDKQIRQIQSPPSAVKGKTDLLEVYEIRWPWLERS